MKGEETSDRGLEKKSQQSGKTVNRGMNTMVFVKADFNTLAVHSQVQATQGKSKFRKGTGPH